MAFSIKDFSDIRKLGEGGMGNVYLATQVALDRKVVIKELASNMQKDPKLIKRFENEAKSAAGLDHENIIRVFDFGEDRHSFFISMEYIDGVDLEQLMRWQPFPREIGLMILLQAMKGLNYAHKQGIIHCDIKPGNILISKTGKVKVVDFGLAKASTRPAEYNDPSSVFITPGYMPPEVANGGEGQSVFMDIWSTGVLAYRIISGRLPFEASDVRKLVYSIVHDKEKNIHSIVPTLPDDYANAVQACLEKNPDRRSASLDRMIESLDNYLFDLGVRDVEKMIMNYVADKNSAENSIAGLLLQYHLQKGNDLLDAGNRVQSDAHFREAEKYGVIDHNLKNSKAPNIQGVSKTRFPGLYAQRIVQKRLLAMKEKPVFFLWASFAKLLPAKKAIPIIGIISVATLGILSAFVIAPKDRTIDSKVPDYLKTTAGQESTPVLDHNSGKLPGVSDTGEEAIAGYAALKHELTPVKEISNVKTPVPLTKTEKKKSQMAFVGNAHDRTRITTSDDGRTGILKLFVEPSSATIMIDGKRVAESEVTEGKKLKVGNHAVVVFSEGYTSFNSILTVGPNTTQFASISLKQKEKGSGLLHIHSYPWAEIYIDDAYQGTAPTPKPLSLSEGDHSLVLKREGFKPYAQTVHVISGEETKIKVQLEQ